MTRGLACGCVLVLLAFGVAQSGLLLRQVNGQDQTDVPAEGAVENSAEELDQTEVSEAAESAQPAAAAARTKGRSLGGAGRGARRRAPERGFGSLGGGLGSGALRRQTENNSEQDNENADTDRFQGVWSTNIGITWSDTKDTLYGFSTETGHWTPLSIDRPVEIQPEVGERIACVQLGDQIAAFSGTVGRWDLLAPTGDLVGEPSISSGHINVRTDQHVYTFAAALGKWTSPTDKSLQAKKESRPGIMHSGPAILSGTSWGRSVSMAPVKPPARPEQPSIAIARQLQAALGQDPNSELVAKLQLELAETVTRAFDSRQKQQQVRMWEMQEKLTQIKATLTARQERRDRIIERRIEELRDPAVDWQAAAGARRPVPAVSHHSLGTSSGRSPAGNTVVSNFGGGGAAVRGATSPRPGQSAATRWDRAESMADRLSEHYGKTIRWNRDITEAEEKVQALQISWGAATQQQRNEVAALIVEDQGGRGFAEKSTDIRRLSGRSEGAADRSVFSLFELSETEFEKRRVTTLVKWAARLDLQLRQKAAAHKRLSSTWRRYQAELRDLRLVLRDAMLVHESAQVTSARQQTREKVGLLNDLEDLKAQTAVGRAEIGVQRAENRCEEFARLAIDNPLYDPSTEGDALQASQKLVASIRALYPDHAAWKTPAKPRKETFGIGGFGNVRSGFGRGSDDK